MATSIVSLSEFKAKAAQMLSEMRTAEHAIVLTRRGAASAVIQDFRTHQRLQDALLMLKLMRDLPMRLTRRCRTAGCRASALTGRLRPRPCAASRPARHSTRPSRFRGR